VRVRVEGRSRVFVVAYGCGSRIRVGLDGLGREERVGDLERCVGEASEG
jgi:hypothetical protein